VRSVVTLLVETARRLYEQAPSGEVYRKTEALEHGANEPATPTEDASTVPDDPALALGTQAIETKVRLENPTQTIKRLLDEKSLTVAKLAEKADIHEKTIYRLCAGNEVKAGTRKIIAMELGCQPDQLRWKPYTAKKKRRTKKSVK
jgi:DNA-binding Xre family transcriptional regulator